jgi:hypothetical protein
VTKTVICAALLFLFLAVIVVAPVYESFDHWDQPLASGNDTVLTFIGTLALLGTAIVLNVTVRLILSLFAGSRSSGGLSQNTEQEGLLSICSVVSWESPPGSTVPLRV